VSVHSIITRAFVAGNTSPSAEALLLIPTVL